MTIVERRIDDVTVLELQGRLVFDDGDRAFRARVDELVEQGRMRIVVNLAAVTYIDSCGIGSLVAKFVSLRRKGGDLRFVHVTPRSNRLLQITRLIGIFRIFDSEDEAVASFSSESVA
jgi:anti-sigma B factor antagonist